MRAYLKVKIKSLAVEATIIHHEERVQNPGARGRTRARRQLTRTNEFTEAQRKRLERRLRQPTVARMQTFWGLRQHRTDVVRPEARASLIAYGFLRGLEYRQIEANPQSSPNWDRVASMVRKYGDGDVTARMAEFDAWRGA